jgi:hypothetical protein
VGRWRRPARGAPAAGGYDRRGPCCGAAGTRRRWQGRGREGEGGSIGFNGEVFGVMTQVDLGLTIVGRFDSADSVISINDVN